MTTQTEIDRLIAELDDSRTRARARRALAQVGADAADRLLEVLAQGAGGVPNKRWAAVNLLGSCRHRAAVPVLVAVMRDEPGLRAEAHRALQAITGRELEEDADAWEAALAADGDPVDGTPGAAEAPTTPRRPEEELAHQAVGDLATSIAGEEPNTVCIRIPADRGGNLHVRLDFGGTDRLGDPLLCIHTDCGPATPSLQAIVFRHNVTLRYGCYSVERTEDGTDRAVWRHHTSPLGLLSKHLRDVLLALVSDVEQLRSELAQGEQAYPWRAHSPGQPD